MVERGEVYMFIGKNETIGKTDQLPTTQICIIL